MDRKVLGGRNLPDIWTRFDRLQRTAHKLLAGRGSLHGLFRFSSFEAFDEWKQCHRMSRPARPGEPQCRRGNHGCP